MSIGPSVKKTLVPKLTVPTVIKKVKRIERHFLGIETEILDAREFKRKNYVKGNNFRHACEGKQETATINKMANNKARLRWLRPARIKNTQSALSGRVCIKTINTSLATGRELFGQIQSFSRSLYLLHGRFVGPLCLLHNLLLCMHIHIPICLIRRPIRGPFIAIAFGDRE